MVIPHLETLGCMELQVVEFHLHLYEVPSLLFSCLCKVKTFGCKKLSIAVDFEMTSVSRDWLLSKAVFLGAFFAGIYGAIT